MSLTQAQSENVRRYVELREQRATLSADLKTLDKELEQLKARIMADMAGSWSASYEDGNGSYAVTMKPSRRVSILKDDLLRLKTADPMVPEEARDRYRFADHLIRFVAVGYDLPRTNAIKMDLDGSWVNGKHGPQFQVDGWRELVPPTIEGVLGYLSSGLLKGIGPKTAGEIVQRFGTDSLRVIENEPQRLLEIRGITEEKLEEIKTDYAESKAIRDLMTVLAPFKLTPKTAMKIYEHFGPDGAALLRKSFYQLCQIPGFGFKKVDAIVVKSGGDMQDPMRVRGALFYALEKSRTEGGHLYLEAEKLLGEALALLNEKIPQLDRRLQLPQLAQELRTMVETNVVVSKRGSIYLPHVFVQESETARKVAELVLEQPEPVDLRPVMERIKGRLGITLSSAQYRAVEMAFCHSLSIITGGPGTGKSTILKAVIEAYRELYPEDYALLRQDERILGFTLDNKCDLDTFVGDAESCVYHGDLEAIHSLVTGEFTVDDVYVKGKWMYPAGAFHGAEGGPC